MITYKDLIKYFGSFLVDKDFQSFLVKTFVDLSGYNILDSNYITSELSGVELGFTNNDAVYDDDDQIVFEKGNPIFSHFNLYPKSEILINNFPFDISFKDTRKIIFSKAGLPTKTNQGYTCFLNKAFLIDNYKVNDIIISFDYDSGNDVINFIQIRDNNLRIDLKL